MKKLTNGSHIEGYIYEHNLSQKVSGENSKNPGTEYINGTLDIATDDEMTNIVQVHFSYVTPTYGKTGRPNNNYNILAAIAQGKVGSVMEHGKEYAGKVRIDSAIALNEWYDRQSGELVSVKRNEGGFVHQVSELCDPQHRSTFNVDMVITGVNHVDADEERGVLEHAVLKGCIFDFRNSLLPVEFTVYNPRAMSYFEGAEPSNRNPMFTRVQGQEVSKTIIRKVEEESAFGEPIIKESRSTQREYVITWAQTEPYMWDDESTLTANEFTEMIANREIHLAEIKKRQDDYQASKGSAFAAPASTSKSVYNF